MANYRQIHVSIWKDEWFLDLETDEKLLFVYLFSNESASLAGIYKLAFKVICFETGLSPEKVRAGLEKFERVGKVVYQDGIVWVRNMRKYNRGGPTVYSRILTDLADIPECEVKRQYLAYYAEPEAPNPTPETQEEVPEIPYGYPTDRVNGDGVKCNEMNLNNNGAGAPPATPEQPEPPQRQPSEKDRIRGLLETHFREVTGLPAPKVSTDKQRKSAGSLWWQPLREIAELTAWDEAAARELISAAARRMDGLTISSPNSILKTATAIYAEQKRVNGNHDRRFSEVY